MTDPAIPNSETVAFIYEATKGAPLDIQRQAQSVNNRGLTMLTLGAALLGTGGLSAALRPAHWWAAVPLVFAIIAFAALAVSSIGCIRPRGMRPGAHGDTLWSRFWDCDVNSIRWALVEDIAKASAENYAVLVEKNKWLDRVLVSLAAEAGFVAVTGLVALLAATLP